MGSSPTKGVSVRAQKYVQNDDDNNDDDEMVQTSLPNQTSLCVLNGRTLTHTGRGRPNSAPHMPKRREEDLTDSGVSSGRHSLTSCYEVTDTDLYRKFYRGNNYTKDTDSSQNTIDSRWDPSFENLSLSDKHDKSKSPSKFRKFSRDSLQNSQKPML